MPANGRSRPTNAFPPRKRIHPTRVRAPDLARSVGSRYPPATTSLLQTSLRTANALPLNGLDRSPGGPLGARCGAGTKGLGTRMDWTASRPMGTGPRASVRRRRLGGAVLTLAVLSAVFSSIDGLARRRAIRTQVHSIAVLPFQYTGNPAQQFLSDGLGRMLADKLGTLPTVRTVPWLTSQRYGGDSVTPAVLGRELRAEILATGTVRAAADSLEAGVVLVNAESGTPIWQTWLSARTALDLQNAVIEAVATRVRGSLTNSQRRRLHVDCHDSHSYEDYLEGMASLQRNTSAANARAATLFTQAIQLDSTFALAHAGLGAAHLERFVMRWDADDAVLDVAQRSFCRAVFFDPRLLEAHEGMIHFAWLSGRLPAALEQGRAVAVQVVPVPGVQLVRAQAYLYGGLPSKAVPLLEQVIAVDPNNAVAHWSLVAAAARCGRFGDTLLFGDEYLRLFRSDPDVHFWMAAAAQQLGDLNGARWHLQSATVLDPTPRCREMLASVLRGLKFPELAGLADQEVFLALQRERDLAPRRVDVQAGMAAALARLGRVEECVALAAQLEPQAATNERVARLLVAAYDDAGDTKSAARVLRVKIAAGLVTEDDLVFAGPPLGLGRFMWATEYDAERVAYRKALDERLRSY